MIILSVGMPRAGSGWYYNLTNSIMLASGARDARQIRQRYHLQSILTEVNCNIGTLTFKRLLPVLIPSLIGNTFVIKAHASPTPMASFLIQNGWMKTTYIYRDPRDALLSALENGERARTAKRRNAFSSLENLDDGLSYMLTYLDIWDKWMQHKQVLHVRYEDLLTNYDLEAKKLIDFLKIDQFDHHIQTEISKFNPENTFPEQKGIHFSQGKIGRYRKKMNQADQEKMNISFMPYLKQMGYE
jgi:hypothetical protein